MLGEFVQPGETLDYVNPTENSIAAGTIIVYGSKIGVAATDIPAGELGSIAVEGVWRIPKGSEEIEAGAAVYYDSATDKAAAEAADKPYIGFAVAAAKAADTTVAVKINA